MSDSLSSLGSPSSPSTSNQSRILPTLVFFLFAMLFWFTRTTYWHTIAEEPFSDMYDYYVIAHRILCCGDLSHSPFWQSYQKPSISVFGALIFAIVGEHNLDGWRISLGIFSFASLLWLCRELYYTTKCWIPSAALLLVVAMSKSSVFWSYKFATEGLAEAILYLVSAFSLLTYRKQNLNLVWYIVFGAIFMFGCYNRPNCAIVAPVIVLSMIFRSKELPLKEKILKNIQPIVCFCAGLALIILPWTIRTYYLYGHVVVSPIQGAYSFLWELGGVTLKEDGKVEYKDVSALQAEAPRKFANDYEASLYARKFVRSWIRENWSTLYPKLIAYRFTNTIWEKDIALSKVSRRILFDSWKDRLVFDKTPLRFFIGLIGLLCGCLLWSGFFLVTASAVLPWLFGILFLSDPRILEPSLPVILFGNIVLLYFIALNLRRVLKR